MTEVLEEEEADRMFVKTAVKGLGLESPAKAATLDRVDVCVDVASLNLGFAKWPCKCNMTQLRVSPNLTLASAYTVQTLGRPRKRPYQASPCASGYCTCKLTV